MAIFISRVVGAALLFVGSISSSRLESKLGVSLSWWGRVNDGLLRISGRRIRPAKRQSIDTRTQVWDGAKPTHRLRPSCDGRPRMTEKCLAPRLREVPRTID
jgi:hypothetical protein